jgi:hypothetical protein
MRNMNPSEKRFFETLLRENYVKPGDRGEDLQSSHELRRELRRELEGEKYEFYEPQESLEEEPFEETERREHWRDEDIGYMKFSTLSEGHQSTSETVKLVRLLQQAITVPNITSASEREIPTQLKQPTQDIEIEL